MNVPGEASGRIAQASRQPTQESARAFMARGHDGGDAVYVLKGRLLKVVATTPGCGRLSGGHHASETGK
jgi:hypothetical protein